MLHIAFGADTKYIMQSEVAMTSLFENNRDMSLCIHILALCDEDKLEQFNVLKECSEKYNHNIEIIRITPTHFEGLPESSYISKATYLRLLLPRLLGEDIEQILYLDSDIIVLGSLKYFTENPLAQDEACAAAIDVNGQSTKHHNRIGMPIGRLYHNAGVLFMNLTYWRKYDITSKTLENIHKYQYAFQDQDAINAILYDKIRTISYKYNLQTSHFLYPANEQELDSVYHQDLLESMDNPVIIHYASYRKPWQKECPLQEFWLKYKSMTVWDNVPLEPGTVNADTMREWYLKAIDGHEGLFHRFSPVYYRLFYYASNCKGARYWLPFISILQSFETCLMKLIYLLIPQKKNDTKSYSLLLD